MYFSKRRIGRGQAIRDQSSLSKKRHEDIEVRANELTRIPVCSWFTRESGPLSDAFVSTRREEKGSGIYQIPVKSSEESKTLEK